MVRRVAYLTAVAGLTLSLAGCAYHFLGMEQRASWREDAESACLQRQEVVASPFIQRVKEVNGRGACGIEYPWNIAAVMAGTVAIRPAATLGCPVTEGVEAWMRESVQPAAIAWFGVPAVEIKQLSAYSCRSRNNRRGARLSEHAFGNALDIAGFKLADGRTVTVKGGWRGRADEQKFLREIAATACQRFKTFLGPGAANHSDHFHVDFARHGKKGTSRYCRPTPQVVPPRRAPYGDSRMAFVAPEPGEMMTEAPEEVQQELSDPLGVYLMQNEAGGLSYSEP